MSGSLPVPPSEALWASLAASSGELLWAVDAAACCTYLSPGAVRRLYLCDASELLGRPLHDLAVEELRARDQAVLGRVLEGQAVVRHETRHRRRDGSIVDLSINAVPLRDAGGALLGATGTARDIGEERAAAAALHESVEKLRLAVDAADLVYWEWDQATDRLQWGRDPSGRLGALQGRSMPWKEYVRLVHPEDRERYLAEANAAWENRQAYVAEHRLLGRDGQAAWILARGKILGDPARGNARMIGVSQDVTARKHREEEERFLAYHDMLTGLPNRRLLDDRLGQALHLARRRGTRLAVMLVDLDDFKQVNDRAGHPAGDVALREVAQRLATCMRKADTLARQGGDEFAVVVPELSQESDCTVIAEKILRVMRPPLGVQGGPLSLGASIGISLFPADARDGEALLRNADAAMYRAKHSGGNRYRYYGQ